jgi:hypothetical protein
MARAQNSASRLSPRRPVKTGTLDETSVTVHVPLAFRRRRGRKLLVAPDGAGRVPQTAPAPPRHPMGEVPPAAKGLARAFRWRKLLETGAMSTVHEIAAAENINPSYVSRILRLTLLAPEVVEALMTISAADAHSLDRLMKPFPVEWQMHRSMFGRNDDRLGA